MTLSTKLLILLLSSAGLFFTGYFSGKAAEIKAAQVRQLKAVQRAIDQANQITQQDAALLAESDVKREQRRVVSKKLDKEIEKNVATNPAYLDCGLDATGLRNWNAGNTGDDAALPGQSGYRLPAAALGHLRRSGGTGAKPQDVDGPVSPMQSSLPIGTAAPESP